MRDEGNHKGVTISDWRAVELQELVKAEPRSDWLAALGPISAVSQLRTALTDDRYQTQWKSHWINQGIDVRHSLATIGPRLSGFLRVETDQLLGSLPEESGKSKALLGFETEEGRNLISDLCRAVLDKSRTRQARHEAWFDMLFAYDTEEVATLEVERRVLVLRELLEAADVDAETTLLSVGDVLMDQAFAVEQARGHALDGSRRGRSDPFADAGASWEERLGLARALVTGGGRRGRRVVYLAAADARIRAQPWARHGPIQLFDGPWLRSVFEAILADPLTFVPAAPEGLPPELDRAGRSGDPGALLREAQAGESVVILRVDLGEGTVRTAVAEAIAASGLLLSAASFVSDNAPGWRLLQSYHVFVDDESAGARWSRDEVRWPLHSGEGALEAIGETLSTQAREESTDFRGSAALASE